MTLMTKILLTCISLTNTDSELNVYADSLNFSVSKTGTALVSVEAYAKITDGGISTDEALVNFSRQEFIFDYKSTNPIPYRQVDDLISFSLDVKQEITDKENLELTYSEFSITYVLDVETLQYQTTVKSGEDSLKTFGRCVQVNP